MLARLWDAQVPIAWVVADTVYGGNLDLRNWLEAHQYPYVLAVPCNEPVGILTRDGQRKRVEVWEVEALLLGAQDWQRLSMSEGTKGPRLFDWASVPTFCLKTRADLAQFTTSTMSTVLPCAGSLPREDGCT
jgi:SRSO17 transposase